MIYINEIFASIQGEGEYIGNYQLFIRSAGCNNTCPYCDTDNQFNRSFIVNGKEYDNPISKEILIDIITTNFDLSVFHSISLTGGEPLLQLEFLIEFITQVKKIDKKILFFLETSGIPSDKLILADKFIDIMSIDLKMHNSDVISNIPALLLILQQLTHSSYYLKLPFDSKNYDEKELDNLITILELNDVKSVIIQPIDNIIEESVIDFLFKKFKNSTISIKIIAQTHKLLNVR